MWAAAWMLALLLVTAVIGLQVLNRHLNLAGNVVAQRAANHPHPLRVLGADGQWADIHSMSARSAAAALRPLYHRNGMRVDHWLVSREPTGRIDRALNTLVRQEILCIQLSPLDFEFETTFLPGFEGTTAAERLDTGGHQFTLTANFHDPDGRPLGWVVNQGAEVNPMFPAWSGFFFVKDGRPWFGPRSLLEETAGTLTEAFQVYPSLMKNHTVFSYVDLQPDRFFDGRRITHRSLAGVRRDGTVVFILSGTGGVLNVAEAARLAHLANLQHATLLDGGRALQYSIRDGRFHHRFHAFNTELDWLPDRLSPVRPPVFLAATRRAAVDIPPPP